MVVEQCLTFEYGGVPGGRGRKVAHLVVEQCLTFEYGGVPGGRGREVPHEVVEQCLTFEYGGVPVGRGREVPHEVVELLGGGRVVGNRRRSYLLLHCVPAFFNFCPSLKCEHSKLSWDKRILDAQKYFEGCISKRCLLIKQQQKNGNMRTVSAKFLTGSGECQKNERVLSLRFV